MNYLANKHDGGCRGMWMLLGLALCCAALSAGAQGPLGHDAFAFRMYSVNYGFYPFVQVYFRTFDQDREPLTNVNYANIGVMVKGKSYDPQKVDPATRRAQYSIETLQNRAESFRTVFVWDCSLSMAGQPFSDARSAITKFIQAKRPGDQVAILAIRDTNEGYEIVSLFEKDPTLLYQRIEDVKCDGKQTRLYDSVGAAMEMCATAAQGDINNLGAEYAVLNNIVVVSDGKDEGSAVSREELISRLSILKIPVPVYSLAYSKVDKANFKNLEAISKATFGRYWTVAETQAFASTVQKIHTINRSDYVVTFRSYVAVDGESHKFKIGLTYPSGSGRALYQDGEFEAIESPAAFNPRSKEYFEKLNAGYPALPGGPYMDAPGAEQAPAEAPKAPRTSAAPAIIQDSGSGPGPGTDAGAPAPAAKADASEPAPASPTPKEETSVRAFLEGNAGLLALGAGIVVFLAAVVVWVRRGTPASAPQRVGMVNESNRTTSTNGAAARGESGTLASRR